MSNLVSRLFGKTNAFDMAIMIMISVALLGFGLAREGHAGVNKVITGETKIAIDVYVAGLKTSDTNLFRVGDKSALTIRNQPVYPPFTVTAVKHWPKQICFLNPDGKKSVSFPDTSQPFVHDFLVTISDQADVTADGYVVRGNKIKIGNQVELENNKYRVQGVVIDIRPQS